MKIAIVAMKTIPAAANVSRPNIVRLEIKGAANKAANKIAGRTLGNMYPGNFEPENEKNTSGTIIQTNANVRAASIFENNPLAAFQTPPKKNGSHGSVISGSTHQKKMNGCGCLYLFDVNR